LYLRIKGIFVCVDATRKEEYLIDTHVLLWALGSSDKIPEKIKEILINPQNEICISSVSLWEISIKVSVGKLKLNQSLSSFLDIVESGNFTIFGLETDYCKRQGDLPFIHKDPFDRNLIATAICENCVMITADDNIRMYPIPVLWN